MFSYSLMRVFKKTLSVLDMVSVSPDCFFPLFVLLSVFYFRSLPQKSGTLVVCT